MRDNQFAFFLRRSLYPLIAVATVGAVTVATPSSAAEPRFGALKLNQLPEISGLKRFIRNEDLAVVLGKAFFWDMRAGTHGQACASCHFHAGVDVRTKNSLNPATRHSAGASVGEIYNPTRGGGGGPNYTLRHDDFPFHAKADPGDRTSGVLFDTDDIVSSQGVLQGELLGIGADGEEECIDSPDHLFQVGGHNVRRVAPRNTPTMINAAFNLRNFWDGRANETFNGVDPFGRRNKGAFALRQKRDGTVVKGRVLLSNSSLASQAVGPPLSTSEMSCVGRVFPHLGKKLLDREPLELQGVHVNDSVLGPYRDPHDGTGLRLTYRQLIAKAFKESWWVSDLLFTADGEFATGRTGEEQFDHMSANFALFWGLAIQAYERTLVSNRTPFDRYLSSSRNPDRRTGFTDVERLGLDVFNGKGRCASCHSGPLLTNATVAALREDGVVGRMHAADRVRGPVIYDTGFYNIGVRPVVEDLGVGGNDAFGNPLSFAAQYVDSLFNDKTVDRVRVDVCDFDVPFTPESAGDLTGDGVDDAFPADTRLRARRCKGAASALEPVGPESVVRTLPLAVDGAFKVPGLRNVALTGPYMHNGGMSTLEQVIEFYDRGGDFAHESRGVLDRGITPLHLTEEEEEGLHAFLLTLTDPRVRWERAPFDHPELLIPNGHPGDERAIDCALNSIRACDDVLRIPAVGRKGRAPLGLAPLESFAERLDP